jgi:hypothetical protein
MSPDRQLLTTLAALRRQWRQRILLESLVWILAAALLATLVTAFLLRDAGSERVVVIARVGAWTLLVATLLRSLARPS